jgi:hypothetical protein
VERSFSLVYLLHASDQDLPGPPLQRLHNRTLAIPPGLVAPGAGGEGRKDKPPAGAVEEVGRRRPCMSGVKADGSGETKQEAGCK